MVRNIVLAASTLAVLGLIVVGYAVLVQRPHWEDTQREQMEPPLAPSDDVEPMHIQGALDVPPGEELVFRVFDPRTGQPTDMFRCADWQPVPELKNEIRVSQPRLSLRMPGGMIASISADEGQIAVDRVETSSMRPNRGWLAGNVKIVVDRSTALDRTPAAERPDDLIVVAMDQLQFDLELGELETDDDLTVTSREFRIAGQGLHLIWNQAENRIDTLTLREGNEFVLYGAGDLISATTETTPPPTTPTTIAATAPANRPEKPRKRTTYVCTLSGGVQAGQFHDDNLLGGIVADQLQLLFDVGGAAGRALEHSRPEAPASQPAAEPRDRLVVRWSGPLTIVPEQTTATEEAGRMQMVATGTPVVLSRAEGEIRCGRVTYHDETQRIWLDPLPGQKVQFAVGPGLSASAEAVYVARQQQLVKLIGDVTLISRDNAGAVRSSIHSSYWTELHLAAGRTSTTETAQTTPTADPGLGAVVGAGRIESATFVGDVQVDLGGQQVTAHRLDVTFDTAGDEQSLEQSLRHALASGGVRLTSGAAAVTAAQLELDFAQMPDGKVYPSQMRAVGTVEIARDRARLRGDRVTALLAPTAGSGAAARAGLVIQELDVDGRSELLDPENRVGVRGTQIHALFSAQNQLQTATVLGTADDHAVVYYQGATVRGEQIDIDHPALTLGVDGASRLSFKAQRGIDGERLGGDRRVVVTSTEQLLLDWKQDQIRFAGDVVARSGNEQLHADVLTLHFERLAAATTPTAAARSDWEKLWTLGRQMMRSGGVGTPDGDELNVLAFDSERSVRKEPAWLRAENALFQSEAYTPGEDQPITHASISAPDLYVYIAERRFETVGDTRLLMMNRGRAATQPDAPREPLGLSSALVSRGPSQTAMQCNERMTYVLGSAEDPRDSAVFLGDVFFVHRTGKEMVNLAQMLPELAADPERLDALRSRNASLECERLECWFGIEQGGAAHGDGALTGRGRTLDSLTASDSVYLRDVESESRILEVNAAWLHFERHDQNEAALAAANDDGDVTPVTPPSRLEIRGDGSSEARIYLEDQASGQFGFHHGQELVVNLTDGTIRTGDITGQFSRP